MDIWLSPEFKDWLHHLRDFRAQKRIVARLRRAAEGSFGQTRSLEAGLSEMKIDEGPGYRLYYTIDQGRLIVFLCGGDKTQERDIARARRSLQLRDWLQ
jgi:putative addiction module killer protein